MNDQLGIPEPKSLITGQKEVLHHCIVADEAFPPICDETFPKNQNC